MSGQRDHGVFEAELSGRNFDARLTRRLLRWLLPYRGWLLASGALVVGASTLAVQITCVSPNSTSTEPSACLV